MTAEEKIYAILSNAAPVIAIVPAANIKVPGDWQSLQVPYIIHQPIVGRTIHTHSEGLQALRIWDFYTVEVYAASHGQARQIMDVIVAALDGYKDADVQRIALIKTPTAMPYDTDRKIACVSADFEVAGHLT